MSNHSTAQVPSHDENGPRTAHPVQRAFDSSNASVALVDIPTIYDGAPPSETLQAILTGFGSRKLASFTSNQMRTLLNELAFNASTVINEDTYTIPSLSDIAHKVKAATPRAALFEHLDLWLVALQLHALLDFGDISAEDGSDAACDVGGCWV